MELPDFLKQFGLSDRETLIYIALLKSKGTTVPEIAKTVKMDKSNVYDVLGKMEQKGLISHVIKEKKTIFSPVHPHRFFEILENKKEDLEQVYPLMEKLYASKKKDREIEVFSGTSGIRAFFDDVLMVGQDMDVIGSAMQMVPVMQHRLVNFLTKLEKMKITGRMVLVDNPEIRKSAKAIYKVPGAKLRFYPEQFLSQVTFGIYGNRVAMVIWEDKPIVIVIKDSSVSDAFRGNFEMIWSISNK